MDMIELERRRGARNYDPPGIVMTRGQGAWLWDDRGRRYLDMMSAYSAVSHGHAHPRILAALNAQAGRLAVTSRAFHTDRLAPFLDRLCLAAGLDKALPMNTGAEAVETAIKAARRWGYRVKGIAQDKAEIVVADGNFHGRTTTIVGFSSEPAYRDGFGPFAPGFRRVPFGDLSAAAEAIGPNTAAILVEPIQGEAGIVVPPSGWLAGLRRLCDHHHVLLILDEVQSGLGRTGKWFAFQHEPGLQPDGLIVGKALGGGVLPVSAFLANSEVMDLFEPGSHGSTFGGNPLAAAVGLEALQVIEDERLVERSAILGVHMLNRLSRNDSPIIKDVRGLGLWVGVEIDPAMADAARICARLADQGVLTKETHRTVLRFAPPLVIAKADLDWGLDRFEHVIGEFESNLPTTDRRRMPKRERPESEMQMSKMSASKINVRTKRIAMSPPDHFSVDYVINPWMDPASWKASAGELARDARNGWRALKETYERLGVTVELQPAVPGLPDLVFTANSAVVLDGVALLARFRFAERQGEEAHGRQFFESLRRRGHIDRIEEMPEGVYFEGAGDAIWDDQRQVFWVGYGPRSSMEARAVIARTFGQNTLPLRLVDLQFYHLDTCLCILPGGEALHFPPAFDEAGLSLLREIIGEDRLIEVPEADALKLAANAFTVPPHDVVMGSCSPALEARLGEYGYRVHRVDLGSFARSGGSSFCLTLRLDARSRSFSAATTDETSVAAE